MKTGTYTGNGSDAKRTVETGGRGCCVLITSLNGMAILTNGSGIGATGSGTLKGIIYDDAHFINGTITLTTTDTKFNASGVTYQYQVL